MERDAAGGASTRAERRPRGQQRSGTPPVPAQSPAAPGPPSRDHRPRGSGPRGEQVACRTRSPKLAGGDQARAVGAPGRHPRGRPANLGAGSISLPVHGPRAPLRPLVAGSHVSALCRLWPSVLRASPRRRRDELGLSPSRWVPSARGSCPPPARGGTKPPSWKALLSGPDPGRCPRRRDRAPRRDLPRGTRPHRQHGGGAPAQLLRVLAPLCPQPRDSWDMRSVVSVTIPVFGFVSPRRWEKRPHNVGGRSSQGTTPGQVTSV